jgi:L-asparagine oxygenase
VSTKRGQGHTIDRDAGVPLSWHYPNREQWEVTILRIDLPDAVRSALGRHLADVCRPWVPVEDVLPQLVQASALLPLEVVRDVMSFRADPHADAALLVTGLPIDPDLPPTPVESVGPLNKSGRVSECAVLLFAVLLGEPVAYAAEKGGVLVQDVFPTNDQRDTPSNESSAAPLGFHTELVFSSETPDRPYHLSAPDFVLLLGLRCTADRVAATLFVEAKAVCDELSDQQLDCLRGANYRLMAPYSFTRGADGSRPLSPLVPLLRGPVDAPSLAFDSACGVQAASPAAEKALAALVAVCEKDSVHQQVRLGPGDLLVLNNNRCAHARSAFKANFDGRDRWLKRAYVRHSIWPLPAAPLNTYRVLA